MIGLATVLALCALSPAAADSASIVDAVRSAVGERFRNEFPLRHDTAGGPERPVVEGFRLPRREQANVPAAYRVASLPPGTLRGPLTVIVEAVSGTGAVSRFPVSCTVRTFGNVLVAVRRFDRHAAFDGEGIAVRRMETTRLPADVLADAAALSGQRAKRILNAGTLLCAGMCEPLPAVHQGDEVTLVARSAGVRMTMQAVAKQDGLPGATILVQPAGSHGRLRSRVIDGHTVEVLADGNR